MSSAAESVKGARRRQKVQDYWPGPIVPPPLFVWPWRPVAFLKWVFGFPGYLWPWNALYLPIAVATWYWLTPDLVAMRTIHAWWIAAILLRNALLILAVAGVWHLRLYVHRAQGTEFKYSGR